MKLHDLKTWPESFSAIWRGTKTHEVRVDDRGFEIGDHLLLREFTPCATCDGEGRLFQPIRPCCDAPHGHYTGAWVLARVTHVTPGGSFRLPVDLCVMSIRVDATSWATGDFDVQAVLDHLAGRASMDLDIVPRKQLP